jgi:hypothetical protein
VTWSDDAAGKRLHLSRSAKLGPHPSTRSHTSCRPFFAPDNKHHAKFPRHLAFLHHETPLHLPSLTGNSHHLTLKMSAPSLDPPKAATYTIHPNKQCGVVKEDGNPCSTRLGCRIHSEGEKLVVKRSRRHQKFLRKQLAFDPLRLAPVFDPDVHCGVDLSRKICCAATRTLSTNRQRFRVGVHLSTLSSESTKRTRPVHSRRAVMTPGSTIPTQTAVRERKTADAVKVCFHAHFTS